MLHARKHRRLDLTELDHGVDRVLRKFQRTDHVDCHRPSDPHRFTHLAPPS